jgi:hypothetical protein
MSDEYTGKDAKFILNSDAHKKAIAKLNDDLESKIQACDPKDKDLAQVLIINKQAIASITKAYDSLIDDTDFNIVLMDMSKSA